MFKFPNWPASSYIPLALPYARHSQNKQKITNSGREKVGFLNANLDGMDRGKNGGFV
jgi:hypothetical protein